MEVWMLFAVFAAGYVGSVYSWPWVRAKWYGVEGEAQQLRLRAIKIENSIRGRF